MSFYSAPTVPMAWAPTSRKRSRTASLLVVKKKRKTSNRKASKLVVRQLGQIMPDKFVTSMTYNYFGQEAPAVTAQFDHQFNMNSIYDPDRTGGGHQPLGRDQIAALYSRYRVISCRWVVDCMPQAGAGPILLVTCPTNETGAFTSNKETAIEQPYSQYKFSNCLSTSIGTDDRHMQIRGSTILSKIYGVSAEVAAADDRFQAGSGTDPAEFCILHVVGYNCDGNAIVVDLNVKLVFTVEWSDRVQLAAS